MPVALFAALLGSLAIHAAALLSVEGEPFGSSSEPPPLRAELKPLPPPPAPPVREAPPAPATPPPKPVARPRIVQHKPAPVSAPAPAVPEAADVQESAPATPATVITPSAPPATPVLPASGTIRFAIFKVPLGLQVGRAEHRWEFAGDGRYRLSAVTETSGLVSLFKRLRLETESAGRLVAGGLQPETYRTLKNGQDANENADFDWSTAQVRLTRDGSVQAVAPGTQDLLSLNYQLAYLGGLAGGSSLGVVTGKKYERYAIDSLGEEEVETPAGRFRTLHLRALTDQTTEIWIALDQLRLPVKIRFTDRKGDSFEQVATEIGMQ